MKKKFYLRDIDPILFAGIQDQNIKLIENNFNCKIVLRGNELHVDGKIKELDAVESLFNDIIFTINKKGFIDKNDIDILYKPYVKNIERISTELKIFDKYGDYNGIVESSLFYWKTTLRVLRRKLNGSYNIICKKELLEK